MKFFKKLFNKSKRIISEDTVYIDLITFIQNYPLKLYCDTSNTKHHTETYKKIAGVEKGYIIDELFKGFNFMKSPKISQLEKQEKENQIVYEEERNFQVPKGFERYEILHDSKIISFLNEFDYTFQLIKPSEYIVIPPAELCRELLYITENTHLKSDKDIKIKVLIQRYNSHSIAYFLVDIGGYRWAVIHSLTKEVPISCLNSQSHYKESRYNDNYMSIF